MVTFGQKIYRFIKPRGITAKSLADFIPVDQGLVSKWKTGERTLPRDSYVPPMVADFMIQHLSLGAEELQQDYEKIRKKIIAWLFDGKDTPFPYEEQDEEEVDEDETIEPSYSYVGLDGLMAAVRALKRTAAHSKKNPPIKVYVSSEYSMLFSDPVAAKLWEALYTANNEQPVQIVFEQWQDEGKVAEVTNRLMPYIQAGMLELSYLLSAEKYLCYNVSIQAEGACLVMMTEPADGSGSCVAFYIDDAGFLFSMDEVLGKLCARALPMVEIWQSDKNKGANENKYVNRLLGEVGELDMLHYGLNLFYLSPQSYMRLLKLNDFSDSQVRTRVKNFEEQKAAYELMLTHNRCREMIRFDLLDESIHHNMIDTTDVFFYNRNRLQANSAIIKDLLGGMAHYLQSYPNLHMVLLSGQDSSIQASIKLKEDRLLLMHSVGGNMHTVCSENWLLCNEYRRSFEELWTAGRHAVRGKGNVVGAVQSRIEKIGRTHQ